MAEQNPPRASWEQPFVASARKWIAEALEGWAEADYAKVITLAPIAVEHLGKAALWKRNPVLLAILDRASQESFLSLATEPALDNEGLRTIGLNDVLARVPSVYKSRLPISKERKTRLIEARGGAIHAGQFPPKKAQHVLTDALTLCVWLGGMLGLNTGVLFGVNSPTAERLLDERRTERQRQVDQRLAAARARFFKFAQSIGPDLKHDTIAQKEALTWDAVPRLINYESIGTMRQCPGCNQKGVLLGDLELDPQVDVESTPDGLIYNAGFRYYLMPDSFYCNVCALVLQDSEELEVVGLPSERFELTGDELTEELLEYASAQDDWERHVATEHMEASPDDY